MTIHPTSILILLTGLLLAAEPADPIAGDAALAASLRADPLVSRAQTALLAFQRQSWEQGVAGLAFLEAGEIDTAVAICRASLIYTKPDGRVAASGGSVTDPLMLGQALWWVARHTGDPALRAAADGMRDFALTRTERATDGVPYHNGRKRDVWSDTTFTAPPFLAVAGHQDEAVRQYDGMFRRLWEPQKRLWRHIWNDERQRFTDATCWGGGVGWAAAGLMGIIRVWPAERVAERQPQVERLKTILDGCLAYQRPDGLFHDVVDDTATHIEANLANMLAYAIYGGVRGRWLGEPYLAAADRMRAAVRAKVDAGGFVQQVSGAPGFKKPGVSPEGQAFFILMEAAARRAGRPAP